MGSGGMAGDVHTALVIVAPHSERFIVAAMLWDYAYDRTRTTTGPARGKRNAGIRWEALECRFQFTEIAAALNRNTISLIIGFVFVLVLSRATDRRVGTT